MKHFIWLVVAAMALTACGNSAERLAEEAAERALEAEGGGDVDIELGDEGEGSIVVETDEGTESLDFGSGEIPEELSIPVMDGDYVVVSSTVVSGDQTLVTVQLEYADAAVEELAAFYDDYFSDRDDVNTSETDSNGIKSYSWITGDEQVVVTRFDEDGPAGVALTQTG